MSLPLTDANGVVQATTSGAPVSWNAGLGYDVEGNLCVTSVASPADSYSGGRRVSAEGKLVISQSTPDGKPWNYNAGWPMDKNTGATITQSGTPDPSEPRIAGVAVGPLGGIYMTEGGFTWSPEYLYLDGEVGAWYDPSDLSTVFQDAAGTTPVVQPGTVADQPVGLILDKSGGSHHASQSTSTARPLLSARVNSIIASEGTGMADNWRVDTPASSVITDNAAVSPYGEMTACKFEGSGGGGWANMSQDTSVPNGTYTISFWGRTESGSVTDFLGQVFTTTYQKYTRTVTVSSSPYRVYLINMGGDVYTGPALNIWGAQFELGSTATTYQRVTTASDYDGTPGKFPYYLKFDGVDDYLSTAAIDFTGTDQMTVFAGVYKGESAQQVVAELSADTNSHAGSWLLTQPYTFGSRGTSVFTADLLATKSAAMGATNVCTLQAEISADFCAIRLDGVNGTDATGDQGTGNYGNWPLYIGARSGPSLPFNGNLYSLIVAGALYTPLTVFQAEHWVAEKTGVTLGTPGAPVNTAAPVVTGTPSSGNTLTCSQGAWTGAVSYAYQWYDQGTPIVGATTSTYALTDANKGWVMSCTVTATNVIGSTGAPSNAVEVALFPYSGSWIYQTPATGSAPAANCIVHAANQLTRLNVSTTNAAGQYVDFGQMRTGDVITINGQAYIVQATPTMYGSYASIPIDPTTQQPAATYTITVTRP